MAKRKGTFDFTNFEPGQGAEKKHKPDDSKEAKSAPKQNKVTDGLVIEGLIDYSDEVQRKKFYPDCEILSSDKCVLFFHKCHMVAYELFETMISTCPHEKTNAK